MVLMGWELLERKTAKGGPGSFNKMPGNIIDSSHGMLETSGKSSRLYTG